MKDILHQFKNEKIKKTIKGFSMPLYKMLAKVYNGFYLIKSHIWWKLYLFFNQSKENKEWARKIKSKEILFQDTSNFLTMQFQDKNPRYYRYDVIVRYLAIEELHGKKNHFGYSLYKKMIKARDKMDYPKKRVTFLIKNMVLKGFDSHFPIPVNRLKEIVDGGHRLAFAFYLGIEKVPIISHGFNEKVWFGLDWFEKNGFSKKEIDLIKLKKEEIFRKVENDKKNLAKN